MSIASCSPEDVAQHLWGDQTQIECAFDAGSSDDFIVQCAAMALSVEAPFFVTFSNTGMDSFLEHGYLGRREGDGYQVYEIDANGPLSFDGPIWETTWTPCSRFEVSEDCELGEACFSCLAIDAELCGCMLDEGGAARIACPEIDAPPCAASSCLVDGACVPNGWGSDDGCCGCLEGNVSCIEPGWCPGPVTIGRRCETDEECQLMGGAGSGLHCRTDFAGERGVCTRACNYGCPEGTECVAEVPHYDEGVVREMCMRPCEQQAQCDAEMSECDAPGGLSESYCF